MQTNFTSKQLRSPEIAEAESILNACVHCGLCTATCPTYVLLADERDSPRGRIYQIKDMLEKGSKPTARVQGHLDNCLSCLSCMTTCPSDVNYMHLIDIARNYVEEHGHRSTKEKFIRYLLATILPYPGRFRIALILAWLARPFKNLFTRFGFKEITAMLELAPATPFKRAKFNGSGVAKPRKHKAKRVALMTGCVQQVLSPQIHDATLRLLARQGVEVIVPPDEGCCGALVHHMGRHEDALKAARRNVDAWYELMREEPLDAIIINASGCGTMVKDYGHLLKNDGAYARRAQELSALARDVTEFLAEFQQDAPQGWSSIKVAYHSACSLQHGQKINDQPRYLLSQAGYTVLEVPEGHLCCGSAGVYNILHPEISGELRDRKVKNITSLRPDVIATGNIGCMTQIAQGTTIPIVHTVELLDWALGGPCPKNLEILKSKVTDISTIFEKA